jgi:hypothetical protein
MHKINLFSLLFCNINFKTYLRVIVLVNIISSKAYKVSNLNESIPHRGETRNIITIVPFLITYIYCYKYFLNAYNGLAMHRKA